MNKEEIKQLILKVFPPDGDEFVGFMGDGYDDLSRTTLDGEFDLNILVHGIGVILDRSKASLLAEIEGKVPRKEYIPVEGGTKYQRLCEDWNGIREEILKVIREKNVKY